MPVDDDRGAIRSMLENRSDDSLEEQNPQRQAGAPTGQNQGGALTQQPGYQKPAAAQQSVQDASKYMRDRLVGITVPTPAGPATGFAVLVALTDEQIAAALGPYAKEAFTADGAKQAQQPAQAPAQAPVAPPGIAKQ